MTLHNYRSRQVHETLNGVNPSSSFRDMRSAKSGPNLWHIWQVFGPWASLYGANGQIIMTVHNYRPRQSHRTLNGENPSNRYRDMGSTSLAAARPPGQWRQYPSSLKGWGVKRCDGWTDRRTDGLNQSYSCLVAAKNNRAPLLCYFKLCPSFRSHWWIQIAVTVRKHPIWVKFDNFYRAVWPWNLRNDLEEQYATSPMLLQAMCIIS